MTNIEDSLNIRQYIWDQVDSNSYLISCNNKGLLIDAVDLPELYEDIRQFEELTIILTHCHFDHISGLNKLRKINKNVNVISTTSCCECVGNIHKNMSAMANVFLMFYNKTDEFEDIITPFVCDPADITFEGKKDFDWNGHKISLLSVYGHSNDGLIAILDNRYLFTGDTLLSTPTVTRFPTGSKKKFIEKDIPLLASLNKDLIVCPGHGKKDFLRNMLTFK